MSKAIQKFTICAADPKDFVRLVLEYGKKGAWLPDDEYPQLSHYPKHVKLAIEVIDGKGIVEKSKDIIAFEPAYDVETFTKEELDEMDWELLKKVCKEAFGITGRDRNVLINRYLKMLEKLSQEEQQEKQSEVVNVEPKTRKTTKKVEPE